MNEPNDQRPPIDARPVDADVRRDGQRLEVDYTLSDVIPRVMDGWCLMQVENRGGRLVGVYFPD